jgi:hypothetical protein
MKSICLRLAGLLLGMSLAWSVSAQSIPNGSFENWTVSGGLFGQTVTLDEWYGLRIQAGSMGLDFAKPLRDTSAQQGSYAASVSSFVVNPLLATVVHAIVNLIDTTGTIDSTLDLSKPLGTILSPEPQTGVPFLSIVMESGIDLGLPRPALRSMNADILRSLRRLYVG